MKAWISNYIPSDDLENRPDAVLDPNYLVDLSRRPAGGELLDEEEILADVTHHRRIRGNEYNLAGGNKRRKKTRKKRGGNDDWEVGDIISSRWRLIFPDDDDGLDAADLIPVLRDEPLRYKIVKKRRDGKKLWFWLEDMDRPIPQGMTIAPQTYEWLQTHGYKVDREEKFDRKKKISSGGKRRKKTRKKRGGMDHFETIFKNLIAAIGNWRSNYEGDYETEKSKNKFEEIFVNHFKKFIIYDIKHKGNTRN